MVIPAVVGAVLLALFWLIEMGHIDIAELPWFVPRTLLMAGAVMVFIASFFGFFLRDPKRKIGKGIVSPADGTVQKVVSTASEMLISIFLNVHNVHVVRSPVSGRITSVKRMGKGHKPAFTEGSSTNNKVTITIHSSYGRVTVDMITGSFARRIMAYKRTGQAVRRGERIGHMMFGSKVNITVPVHIQPNVIKGSKVRAGETTIGHDTKYDGSSLQGDAWITHKKRKPMTPKVTYRMKKGLD